MINNNNFKTFYKFLAEGKKAISSPDVGDTIYHMESGHKGKVVGVDNTHVHVKYDHENDVSSHRRKGYHFQKSDHHGPNTYFAIIK
jgi:hypothetical protein